jgi:hypothetical protein
MALEQSGLSSLISRFRGRKSKRARSAADGAPTPTRRRAMAVEQLEERRLLVSRVWLDFGEAFPVQTSAPYAGFQVLRQLNPPAVNTAMVGVGAAAGNTYEVDLGILFPTPTTPPYDLVSFGGMINAFNPTFSPDDAFTLEVSIAEQIRRALEPFDIQVFSSHDAALTNVDSPTDSFPAASLAQVTRNLQRNNIAGDGGAPLNGGTATVPQFGSDDVYVFFGGLFQVINNIAVPSLIPISASFAVHQEAPGVRPDRLDGGAFIDVNYFIDSVLGATGTGGSLNVAIANAAMYAIGWSYGVSEVEDGTRGISTQYHDADTRLINQSHAMVEGGWTEFFIDNFSPDGISHRINPNEAQYFSRYNMMQNGTDFQKLMKNPLLGNPSPVFIPGFPLPPPNFPDFWFPDTSINVNPNITLNTYDYLVNDFDIGRNPDVQYVTGTGAFDRIYIRKLSGNRAEVTIKSYRDSAFSSLIDTYEYTIGLTKIVTAGRRDSGRPFRLIVEPGNSNDQVFIDADLGKLVVVHGGPSIERVKFTGNGRYNAEYTPDGPAIDPTFEHFIPEGLQREASGTLRITGDFGVTTIMFDNYNPMNSSAIRLENFNRVTYYSPGYNDTDLNITVPRTNEWNIAGSVDNLAFPLPGSIAPMDALTGNLQFSRVKHLTIDTTLGVQDDTVDFFTDATLSSGLQSVTIEMGAGDDRLRIDDSERLSNLDYFISPTAVDYGAGVSTSFQGFTYSGVQRLTVNGTRGFNDFVVIPSKITEYFVFGDDPGVGFVEGDSLAIRRSGTTGATLTPNGINNGTWTFTSGHRRVVFSSIEEAVLPPSVVALSGASDTGKGKPLVKVYDAATNELFYSFYAYPQSFTGGVRVAVADMNGDNVPDIIVAPGFGRGDVKVYDGAELQSLANSDEFVSNPDDARLKTIVPEGDDYNDQGLYVAVGDVDNDGDNDIVTSRSRGETRVRVFENDGTGKSYSREASWRPYGTNVISGAAVAVADLDKDGLAEVITAPGTGVVATIKAFSGTSGGLKLSFNAFESSFLNGVSLAAGDADGDGRAEIFVGAGTGGDSRVRMFSRTGTKKIEFKAYTSGNVDAPLRIAAVDPDGADRVLLYVGQGNDGESHRIRLFDPLTGKRIDEFVERDSAFEGGVYLG